MTEELDPESAIREVLREGAATDWMEVVDRVHERFGIRVGAGDVERVAAGASREARDPESRASVRMRAGPVAAPTPSPTGDAPGTGAGGAADEVQVAHALRFVEAVGGFDAARTALDRLEQAIRRLGDSR